MPRASHILTRVLLPMVVAGLPVVLLWTSLRTLRELDEQKQVYLRSLVALAAGRLETLPASTTAEGAFEVLGEGEPNLVDLELVERNSLAGEDLSPLFDGRELFRTAFRDSGGRRVFRAWLPFHSASGLRIARIDMDASAADFLVKHARHNVMAASAGGLVLLLLSLYAVWASRRAARLEVRQLEMEHLAHIGKMAAVLAHEIRNPLGAIKGFAQLAGERADAAGRALVEPIVDEALRLENLVNALLLYGRPPAPAVRMARWEEVLEPLRAYAGQTIGARGIRFQAEAAALEWETDPALLRQALLNLLRNAVEAIGDAPGGEIRLECRGREGGGVAVTVADNGPGIPEHVMARLFEPFHTTKASGTGLGLAITRRLVEALGGELALGPAAPRGTVAELRFPHARARAAEAKKEEYGNDSCGG